MASGTPENPSDAILTIPNLITFTRLALIPLFLWLALGPRKTAAAFVLGFVIGSSDWIDGKVARRLGQVSRLGIALDPFSDRIAVAAAAAVLLLRDLAPWWTVAIVLGRDGALLAAVPFLAARGVPRPAVTSIGKWGSFATMWAFGLFLGAAIAQPPAGWVRALAWAFYAPAAALSYLAAFGYARTALTSLSVRHAKPAGG